MIKPVDLGPTSVLTFSLDSIADELRQETAYARSGRTAATLTRDDRMTVALTVARAGATIREHTAPGPVTLVPQSGRIRLVAGDEMVELRPGQAVSFAGEVVHSVEAIDDSAFLIVIGGRSSE